MSPLPLLSGLTSGMVIVHVIDRYAEATWSPRLVFLVGLVGGLALAAEIVCLTWSLSRERRREVVATGPELPSRVAPEPTPKLPSPRVISPVAEGTSREEPSGLPAVSDSLAGPARVATVVREDTEGPPEAPQPERPQLGLSAAPTPDEIASQVERLTVLWNLYLAEGSGLFSVRGLKRQLDKGALAGEVLSGESLGLSDSVAAVDLQDEWGRLYLVPSFTRSTLAVADWFDAPSSNARTALVKRLLRPAILGRTTAGWQCTRRGAIE